MKLTPATVVAITGAGGGIGRATAIAFARQGCAVALSDVNAAGLEATRALLPSGTRATAQVVDVSQLAAVERWRDDIVATLGAVHVVVNNAGITVFGTFEEHTVAQQDRLLGVNLMGVLHGCRAFLPELRRHPAAHIVNISSMAGYVGLPYQSLYCASKFAVRGLSQSLRAELGLAGIGVTSVHPGAVRTGVMTNAPSHGPGTTGKLGELMLRFGLSPDTVARRIVRAVRWNRAEIRMTLECHLTYLATRLAPTLLRWSMAGTMRLGQRVRAELDP